MSSPVAPKRQRTSTRRTASRAPIPCSRPFCLVSSGFWAATSGTSRDHGRLIAEYCKAHVPHSALHRACFLFPHLPSAVQKATWQRMFERLMDSRVFAETVTRRSRGDCESLPTVDPLVVYANWVDVIERRRSSLSRYIECLGHGASRAASWCLPQSWRPRPRFGSFPLGNDAARFNQQLRVLERACPVFFNINDDAYDSYRDHAGLIQPGDAPPNPHSLELLFRTLERLYPTPSRFETRGA